MFTLPERVLDFNQFDFSDFRCLDNVINEYVQDPLKLKRDIDYNNVHCYVVCSKEENRKVAGFFTLKNKSLKNSFFSDSGKKAIHGIPQIGCIELGQLAIHIKFKGMELGSALLLKAEKMYSTYPLNGILLYVIAAPYPKVENFYTAMGYKPMKKFKPYPDCPELQPFFKHRHHVAKPAAFSEITTSPAISDVDVSREPHAATQ